MEAKDALYGDEAKLYDLVYGFKDYRAEAEWIHALIDSRRRVEVRRLLDVACGTGKHLEFLQKYYQCTGTDVSPSMLEIARERVPEVPLAQASMLDMDLGNQFEALTCLFSAIGYAMTIEGLVQTMKSFAQHLVVGGVAIIEPWVLEPHYQEGAIRTHIYHDTPELKVSRTSYSERHGRYSISHFHMVVAEQGKGIRYFDESHVLGLFTVEEYLEAMRQSGLKAEFLPNGFSDTRGLLVGVREH